MRFDKLLQILEFVVIPRLNPENDKSSVAELLKLLDEFESYKLNCVSLSAVCIPLFPGQANVIYQKIQESILSVENKKIKNGYRAVFHVINLMKRKQITAVPNYFWGLITQQFKWRRLEAILPAIDTLKEIILYHEELLRDDILEDVIIGLDYLIEETSLDNLESQIEKGKRLEIRKESACISYGLYRFYKHNSLNIPDTVIQWKNICNSTNEFAEIRKQWSEII